MIEKQAGKILALIKNVFPSISEIPMLSSGHVTKIMF